MTRWRPILKAILIALIINELRGIAVSAAFVGAALIVQITTGAHILPVPPEYLP